MTSKCLTETCGRRCTGPSSVYRNETSHRQAPHPRPTARRVAGASWSARSRSDAPMTSGVVVAKAMCTADQADPRGPRPWPATAIRTALRSGGGADRCSAVRPSSGRSPRRRARPRNWGVRCVRGSPDGRKRRSWTPSGWSPWSETTAGLRVATCPKSEGPSGHRRSAGHLQPR